MEFNYDKTYKIKWRKFIIKKYSLYDLKCLGFPDGKFLFDLPSKPAKYWENKNNILQFLNDLKDKLNLTTAVDWNSLSQNQIISFGGGSLLHKYSLYDLKCLGFPEGKLEFDSSNKPHGYWNNETNVIHFLSKLKTNSI